MNYNFEEKNNIKIIFISLDQAFIIPIKFEFIFINKINKPNNYI